MVKVVSREKVHRNNFYKILFIKYPRPRFVDRLLRLVIDLYIFKFFKN